MRTKLALLLLSMLLLAGCEPPEQERQSSSSSQEKSKEDVSFADMDSSYDGPKLQPLPNFVDTAPTLDEVVTVKFDTDTGSFVVAVFPQAAPNASQRFLELVDAGFYDGTPIFRVVRSPRPFVAQFGINWRDGHFQKKHEYFSDDVSMFELEKGSLAFAKAGPDTNSTQVFVNYANNSVLASPRNGNFAAFALIVDGYSTAEKWKSVGDPSMGLSQDSLWNNGGEYLDSLKDKPSMIQKAYRL